MKKVLIFTIFGPLIGALSIVLFISILGIFSEKSSGDLSGVFFFMFLFCYFYGGISAFLTGVLSLKYNRFTFKDTGILVAFPVIITCLIIHFYFRYKIEALPQMAVLPSAASTLVLSYLLRTNKLREEV